MADNDPLKNRNEADDLILTQILENSDLFGIEDDLIDNADMEIIRSEFKRIRSWYWKQKAH